MYLRLFSSLIVLLLMCGVAQSRTASVGSGGVSLSGSGASTRNIVVIIVDDWGAENMNASAPFPLTPSIDALAAEGVQFTKFWAAPLCSTFRTSAFTGLNPEVHGVGGAINISGSPGQPTVTGLQQETNNIARVLGQRGYRTAAIGKWHMAGVDHPNILTHPNDMGFDSFSGSISNLNKEADNTGTGKLYDDWEKCVDGTCSQSIVYAPTDTTDTAIAALAGTEPFFLWVAYNGVHSPFHKPPIGLATDNEAGCVDPLIQELVCYRAMIEATDAEMGRFMAAVDRNDTTVLFMSDGGTPSIDALTVFPQDATNTKGTVGIYGLEVPLIIVGDAVPFARHGGTTAGFANSTDIYKTVLDLAGTAVPANDRSTAVSLMPLVYNGSAEVRDTLYTSRFKPFGATPDPAQFYLRTLKCSSSHASCNVSYKLVQDLNLGTELFYDKNADNGETSPLTIGTLTGNPLIAYNYLAAQIVIEGARE